jgi:phosphoribosylanthranilate isomerase
VTEIKLCGIYRPEDCGYLNEVRPDYFGMILHFPKSHRNVTEEQAAHLRSLVDPSIPAVGVFVNWPVEDIAALLRRGIIDIAQLHGSEGEADIRFLQEKTGKPVWKAFRIRSQGDVAQAKECPADLVLLDNGYGTGQCFDWSLVGDMGRPFALAGGLTPENLPEAIRAIHPQLVDLSSGVETDKKKDREKMRRAVAAART